ncbi:sugar transporter-domain-containing protein [Xylariaceae sp. FL0255]|nr:sugar transporter-domain-containing protein [Xylariaceae sp. FL0255]
MEHSASRDTADLVVEPAMTTTNSRATAKVESARYVFRKMTLRLFLVWMATAMINIIFGYETTSFGGVQSIPGFVRQFGTEVSPGKWELSAARASYTSSTAFAGKLIGSLVAPFFVERWGHRIAIWVVVATVWIGVILEATSNNIGQFIVGRIVIYFSVGIAEVTSTGYQSEIVPAAMRGTVVGSIQLFNLFGQIFAAGVNRAFSTSTASSGWIVPVSIQAAIPVFIFIFTFFIPDSPRWLLSKGRKEDAIKVLDLIRPDEDVQAGLSRLEINAIQEAIENELEKAPWINMVKGVNLRRSLIGCGLLGLQQLLGQGFVSGYSPRFYATVGLSKYAFDYNIGSATIGWGGALFGMLLSDFVGRRDVLIVGGLFCTTFLFLVAGVGIGDHPTGGDAKALVAGVLLYNFFYSGTWGPLLFTIASEVGAPSLREKTLSLGIALNVITAFVVSFAVPYILNDIGANIGWVFGGIALFSTILVFFVLPETKDRSLEELDELFKARIPARKFKTTKIEGPGSRVTALEGSSYNNKLDDPVDEPNQGTEVA